jgi:FtsH-binding integral membrane protein
VASIEKKGLIMYPNPYGSVRPVPLGYESSANSLTVARFFNTVYGWMAAGLALTAAVAWWVSAHPYIIGQYLSGPMVIGLFIAQIVLVIAVSGAVNRIGPAAATALFLLYAGLNGLTLSFIFLIYTGSAVAGAFVASAATFGAMSLYGFVTRRDLTQLGSFLIMGLIGLVIASVVSIFWHSTALMVLINYVGVFLFLGLTAYDTQRLRAIAYATSGDARRSERYAIVGALTLYLDFINLFMFLLRIMGDRRR